MLLADPILLEQSADLLENVRRVRPLVHCMTNRVTINDCANIILAAGGSPIMAEDEREVEEIVAAAGALVITLGILSETIFPSMLKAGRAAKRLGVPVILDPVGCGASKLRDDCCRQYIDEIHPDIVRGNMSEIKALAGMTSSTRGVDAGIDDAVTLDNAHQMSPLVTDLAKKLGTVVSATAAVDIISDGSRTAFVANGHPMLCDVTGTGCMASALTGACAGAGDAFTAATACLILMGLAGEMAQEAVQAEGRGIGTFRIRHLDYIYTIQREDILERGKVYESR